MIQFHIVKGKQVISFTESPIKTGMSDYKYLSLHVDCSQVSEYNYCIETERLAKKKEKGSRLKQYSKG